MVARGVGLKVLVGLMVEEEFISEKREAELVEYLESQPWDDSIKRRTQHYGKRFDYKNLHASQS